MDYSNVKKDIMNKDLKRFYIFTGEERFVLVKYIHKIVEVSGMRYKPVDKVSACRDTGSSLFSTPSCYVCYDDKEFVDNEKAWDEVTDFIGADNMLILVLSTVDNRKKFFKHFASTIVSFDRLTEPILEKYVTRKVNLNPDNMRYLIQICENDCGRLFMELDKFDPNEDANLQFDKFLDEGILYVPPEDVVFDWVDAILSGDRGKSFALYEDCVRRGEPTLMLLSVLYANTRKLLQVQSCDGNIEEVTGLMKWEINRLRNKANKAYSNRELINAMRLIQKVESGIKTGVVEEEFAIQYVMVNMLA